MTKRLKDVDSGERIMLIELGLKAGGPTLFVLLVVEWKLFPAALPALIIPDVLLAAVVVRLAWHVMGAAGKVANLFLAPNNIPAVKGYSEQDALVIRGHVADAVTSYQALIVANPVDLTARLRLAALLAKDPASAAAAERCFLEVRRRNPSAQEEWIAGNGLIDLYRASGDRQKLKRELGALASRHPGTDAGGHARRYLEELEMEDAGR